MAAVTRGEPVRLHLTDVSAKDRVEETVYPIIKDPSDLTKMCMLDIKEIRAKVERIKEAYTKDIEDFLAMPMEDPSACVEKYRALEDWSTHVTTLYEAMSKVHATPGIQEAFVQGKQQITDHCLSVDSGKGRDMYEKLTRCEESPSLTPSQRYYLSREMSELRFIGYHTENCGKIQDIRRELEKNKATFDENRKTINAPVRVRKEDLAGMPENLIELCKEDGEYYEIPLDTSTYVLMASHCPNPDVRAALYRAFRNIGYCNYADIQIAERDESVNNMKVVEEYVRLRQQWADLAGADSFADLEASTEALKGAAAVEKFLLEILEAIKGGQQDQYDALKEMFPDRVVPGEAKFRAFDTFYLIEQFCQEKYDVDTNELREYFPLKATMGKMMTLFRDFYGVSMERVEVGCPLWADDVEVYKVAFVDNPNHYGYVAFDLYARKGKEPHIYYCNILDGKIFPDGRAAPTFGVVIGNCVRDEEAKEALLTPREVYASLLHEVGHAVQHVLGRRVVLVESMNETPSMVLEEWGKDFNNLRGLSSHYKTGEALDDDTCKRCNDMQRFKASRELASHVFFSLMNLRPFLEGEHKDLHQIEETTFREAQPYYNADELSHVLASLPNITSGADYYKYPLAISIARQLLNQIQKDGSARRFAREVLAKMGEEDSMELIEKYLGCPWSLEAMKKAYGKAPTM